MNKFETWFKSSGWPEKHKIACQDAWECCTGSEEHIHDLEMKYVRLEKENANLKKLIYKCKSLMHARSSFEAYEIWEEVEEQLKEQGE